MLEETLLENSAQTGQRERERGERRVFIFIFGALKQLMMAFVFIFNAAFFLVSKATRSLEF